MKHASIEDKIKAAGGRLTPARRNIFSWLEAHEGMFSAAHLIAAFPDRDRVSIYRTIDLLLSLDIIHATIKLKDFQYYELHGEPHHHHAICVLCQKNACVPCSLPTGKIRGFKKIHHDVSFTGVCYACEAITP
jgi:Fe2+ or Zn2+ uptake regulation protein